MSKQSFSVKVVPNTKDTLKALAVMKTKQIPFATARALTWTAKGAQADLKKKTAKYLDRPTPFTQRGFGITPATKVKPMAFVFIKTLQWKYMKYQVHGGTRLPSRKAIGVPTDNQRRNKYGNLTRGKIKALLADQKNFSGVIHGVPGIYRRTGGKRKPGVKLLIAWEPRTKYRKRFPFSRIVHSYANATYQRNFARSLSQALRSHR